MYRFFKSDKDICISEMKDMQNITDSILTELVLSQQIPNTLFHYTDSSGFIGIISEHSLRATHISYMNDWQEYLYAIEIVKGVAEERHAQSDLQSYFLENLISALDAKLKPIDDYPPIFVSCFSKAENDLSQWRAYAGEEGGYAIEFDANKLGINAWSNNVFLIPVIYNRENQKHFCDKLLNASLDLFENHVNQFSTPQDLDEYAQKWYLTWRTCVSILGPAFKHEGFRKEEEWRLICRVMDYGAINFLARKSIIVPFINLALKNNITLEQQDIASKEADQLPIASVWVGPGRYQDLAFMSAYGHLINNGYVGINIKSSELSVRVVI